MLPCLRTAPVNACAAELARRWRERHARHARHAARCASACARNWPPLAPATADSLNSLLAPEWLEGDNAYSCEYCAQKVSFARVGLACQAMLR